MQLKLLYLRRTRFAPLLAVINEVNYYATIKLFNFKPFTVNVKRRVAPNLPDADRGESNRVPNPQTQMNTD
jgi:hypothetical protein